MPNHSKIDQLAAADPKGIGKGENGTGTAGIAATSHDAAVDVFRTVAGLGGMLVVAVVTPLGAAPNGRSASGARKIALSQLRTLSEQRDEEDAARERQSQDKDRAVVQALAETEKAKLLQTSAPK